MQPLGVVVKHKSGLYSAYSYAQRNDPENRTVIAVWVKRLVLRFIGSVIYRAQGKLRDGYSIITFSPVLWGRGNKHKAPQFERAKRGALFESMVDRVAGCGLRVASCGLRVAGCGLRVASCGLRFASCWMCIRWASKGNNVLLQRLCREYCLCFLIRVAILI